MFASTAVWANPMVVVGSLDLYNSGSGTDFLLITNLTGGGSPAPDQSLLFTNVQLSLNGGAPQSLPNIPAAGGVDEIDNLALASISSFDFTATLVGSSLPYVTVNGSPVEISPTISTLYSGPVLDTSGSCATSWVGCPHFDIDAISTATPVPEPATLTLFGVSLLFLRRRQAKA
jgi:hypothetical protein